MSVDGAFLVLMVQHGPIRLDRRMSTVVPSTARVRFSQFGSASPVAASDFTGEERQIAGSRSIEEAIRHRSSVSARREIILVGTEMHGTPGSIESSWNGPKTDGRARSSPPFFVGFLLTMKPPA